MKNAPRFRRASSGRSSQFIPANVFFFAKASIFLCVGCAMFMPYVYTTLFLPYGGLTLTRLAIVVIGFSGIPLIILGVFGMLSANSAQSSSYSNTENDISRIRHTVETEAIRRKHE